MAAEEDDHDGSRRHGSLAARKIRGRPRHGTELGSREPAREHGLGSTDSCATAVHTKPFSTSVLQGLAGVFATTTKICTDGGSRQARAQTLLRTPPRPSYSSGLRSRELSYDHAPSVEEVFEIANEPLVTSIRHLLQTSEGQEKLHANYGPLGQRYLKAVLSGKKAVNIDVVYGVYFSDEGTMLGDKRITLNKNDDIIIDGQRYDGTPGLYELIFMKFPNESICTDDDVQTYKSILLTTNAYRRGHNAGNQVLGNKGHKYKNIIAPLVLGKKVGTGIKKKLDLPYAMSLTDNRIDYVHWDDPNELVDRLRLLEASRQAGHNGHDNEILSIIEELREAGLIIN
ncbi:hypothetical protein ALC62_15475 [Cyphomyrmex costatus]|uniref:DUF8207 domain-containing protein n=1 Tax=Cyphomyrmex costatus TaxID=456900 RepID=A0A151I6X7_9HYME|nr:hypothetical protein ALC62_15475 [Cyphomyrmex costatus]